MSRYYSKERQSDSSSYRYGRSGSPVDQNNRLEDSNNNETQEDEDDVKPYTAVGAALDSAERFKRRMQYGRVTPKP